MKFIKITFNLILGTILLLSCNDDFLDRFPLDEISDATFWNTENDLRIYNNGIYNESLSNDQINIGHEGNTYTSMTRDIWGETFATNDYNAAHVNRRSGKHPVPNSGQQGGWKGWDLLRHINVGLANYHRADLSAETINRYAAEAKFFRAWFFSDKVQLFGDVPWVGEPMNIDSEEIFGSRMPREQAMDSVFADINFAVEHLPESWPDASSQSTTGRFNKWHALLLKSNIALFEGTWRKYHGGSNPEFWLEEAADAAKELIDFGPYALYSTGDPDNDYREMFANPTTFNLYDNPEVMYWREYQQGILTHMMQTYFHHFAGATKSFVDDYLMIDGRPAITTEGIHPLYMDDKTIEDVFINRDPRMRQTILHPEDAERYRFYEHMPIHPIIVGMGGTKETVTGYQVIKYWNRDMMNLTWGQITQPAIIFRYSLALLNYAEATAELGTITQADLDLSINALRDRVGMPPLELSNVPVDPRYTEVSPIIAEVRRERKIELAFEGLRLKDIYRWKWGHLMREPDLGIRWDQAAIDRYENATVRSSEVQDPITGEVKSYIDVYKGSGYENPVFEENKHYHWPLPLDVLTQNPDLGQNPGWEF